MIIHYNCTIGSFLLHSFLLIYHPYPPSFHEMIFTLVYCSCHVCIILFLQVFGLIHMWAWLFIVLGCASAVATVIKIALFSLASEQLMYQLRCWALSRVLRHPLDWFDQPSSSSVPGLLASDPPLVPGVSSTSSEC